MAIGVLALQGDFGLHGKALDRLGLESVEVEAAAAARLRSKVSSCPGESTTLLKLLDEWGFVPALEKFHAAGKPIMGTCAGLILLAREVESPQQASLGLIDITAERNAYGRQKESFRDGRGGRPRQPASSRSRWSSSGAPHTPAGAGRHAARRCTAGNA